MHSKFWSFINYVCLVIWLHPHHYPYGSAQVRLINILLLGTTLTWFTQLLERQSSLLNNFEAFLKKFIATFGNSNRKCTSTSKLRSFHQGSWHAFVYAFKFRQLTCDISWDKVAFTSQFQFKLYIDMKHLLLTMLDPTTLSQTIAQVVHCDNCFF